MEQRLGPAWHSVLESMAGLAEEDLADPGVRQALALAHGARELALGAVAEALSGRTPTLLGWPGDEGWEPALQEAAAGWLPAPRELVWARLADGHRDLVAALEDAAVCPELQTRLEGWLPRQWRRSASALEAWRAGRSPGLGLIFHMVAPQAWMSRRAAAYSPPSLESEGFIHLTREPERLEQVAELFFHDHPGELCLLVVDVAWIRGELRWEGPGRVFPHLYGPLEPEAVVDVRVMRRDGDGAWRFPWA